MTHTLSVVVPVAPSLVGGVATLGAVVTFTFLWTFQKTFRHLFEPVLLKVANIGFGGVRGVGAVHPFSFLKTIVNNVNNWTNQGLAASERAIVWGCHTVMWSISELAKTAEAMAHNYALAFNGVWHGIQHTVPRVVHQTVVRPVQKAAHYSDAKLRAHIRAIESEIAHLAARVSHLTHATAGAIAAPFPRIGKLEREIANAVKGLRNIKNLAKYATLAALGAAILAKLGVSYTRCSRSKQFGKQLCKTNADWMKDFFAATIAFTTAASVVQFAEEARAAEEVALESIQFLIRELGDLELDRVVAAANGFATITTDL